MIRKLPKIGLLVACLLFLGLASRAEAVPLLQLDLQGGVYDPVTETIVAPGGNFTLYAILTPKTNATAADITALLSKQYFVAGALSPQLAPPGASLGSFTLGLSGGTQNTISATSGMTYGVPPLETTVALQGFDPGDLSQHGIYPTYFTELGFYFSAAQKTVTYNTATNPGGVTPSATGTSYYVAITGNNTLLSALYQLHFDLYNEAVRNCAAKKSPTPCSDVDIDSFAPFSHDAQVTPPPVPEPAAALLMLTGFGVGARGAWRRRSRRA